MEETTSVNILKDTTKERKFLIPTRTLRKRKYSQVLQNTMEPSGSSEQNKTSLKSEVTSKERKCLTSNEEAETLASSVLTANVTSAQGMDGPAGTRVTLLACGSFNPITNMHLRMFELARDHLKDSGFQVVKGIISPVGDGYKKKGLIEARYRLEMARLASQNSWITVDSWEGLQTEWVETVKVVRHHYNELVALEQNDDDEDTVKYGKRRRIEDNYVCSSSQNSDGTRLMLLCGADLLESFGVPNLWKQEDIEEIVGRFGLVCVTRAGNDPLKFIHESDTLWKHHKNIHIVQEWVTNEMSSTHVRRALCQRRSVRYLLPDSVLKYIHEHQLYSEESEQKNTGVMLAPLQSYSGAQAKYHCKRATCSYKKI